MPVKVEERCLFLKFGDERLVTMGFSGRNKIKVNWVNDREDRETCFIKKQGATYLLRLIKNKPVLEEPDLDFAIWVLGPRAGILADRLAKNLKGSRALELEPRLIKAKGVPDDLPECILEILNEQPRSVSTNFLDELRHFLEERANESLYGKPSHLERSLERFRRLFGLDDAEMEFCLVFYLMRAHKRASEFLDDHLELDRLTGRDRLRTILGLSHTRLVRMLNGKLTRMGIITDGPICHELSDEFLPFLLDSATETAPGHMFRKVPNETLPLDHHEIDPEVVEHLMVLLSKKFPGPTHVLLYGDAGTGKPASPVDW